MARAVRGVILDESVLLAALGDGCSLLQPDADPLLRRLRHSRIPTGILNEDDASAEKKERNAFACYAPTAPGVNLGFSNGFFMQLAE
ncbi:hypothetical protein NL676_019141 [Syzygium grande]|nr:hypothetical protein NL676_019141 [Syzygium grande]